MQVCKNKFLLALSSFLILNGMNLFAQATQDRNTSRQSVAPVAPIAPISGIRPVQGLQMPDISSPSHSMNYYTPGQKTKSPKSVEKPADPVAASKTVQTSVASATNNQYLNQLNGLTAADLSSLSNQGLLNDIGSLFGGSGNVALSGVNGQNQNAVLNQILVELNEIKANQKNLVTPDMSKLKPSNEPPAILRFVVNNQDVLKACKAVYFSNVESDGSFLLTGDCRSLYNNNTLNETFYALFKASGTKDGHNIYQVEVNISQNAENKNSALYKFCAQKNLMASKTGNLIILRANDANFKGDLLIDIGR